MKPFLTVQILVFAMSLLMASPVMAEILVNLSSGYCLDTDGSAVNGGAVRMWECAVHTNQTWTVEQVDSKFYRLINHSSKFCLDTDGSKMNRTQVRMWECADHPNQLWEIHPLPENSYRLKNKASGFCLDTDGSAANGGEVRMWECATHTNQSWLKRERYDAEHVTTLDMGRRAADIEFSPSGDFAFVNNFDDNTVSVIDTGRNRVVGTIRVGEAPQRPVAATNDRVYVPNSGRGREGNSTVSIIDVTKKTVIKDIEIGVGPSAGAATFMQCKFQPCENDKILVTNFNRGRSGTISVIDTTTNRVVHTIGVGNGPIDIDIPFLGRKAYVANNNSRTVTVIDIPSFAIAATIPVPGYPTAIFADAHPSLNKVFVSHTNPNGISVIDTQREAVTNTLKTSYEPGRITSPPIGPINHILVPIFTEKRVDRIDFRRRMRVETISADYPRSVAINLRYGGYDTYVVGNNEVKVFNSGFVEERRT